jgi:hypothetical protein
LKAINSIVQGSRFSLIIWFSARDIELLPHGPKPVQAHVLNIEEIAKEYARLLEPSESKQSGFKPLDFLRTQLSVVKPYGTALYIFDNFETFRNLGDVYQFIDTYIRLPNKALITTRIRDFKGDYPIEVSGMSDEEGSQLIDSVATSLKIEHLLSAEYRQEILTESGGHPYVIKILLGEVAKANQRMKINRVMATQEQVLTALFERTYQALTPAAKRVFVTLCNWRSMVPVLGLKAVLMRPTNERMDVDAAIEELRKCSLIEFINSQADGQVFVDVPLSASEFGRQKLRVDPLKTAAEADGQILRAFGPTQETDIRRGLGPGVERLFRYVSQAAARKGAITEEHLAILEFVANSYPSAWLLLAELYEEIGGNQAYDGAKKALLKYIEHGSTTSSMRTEAWERLGIMAHRQGDGFMEIHANVEMCQDRKIPFWKISNAANRINGRLRDVMAEIDKDERRILVKKLAEVMEARFEEGDATDMSRLAWLWLKLGDEDKALYFARIGLERDQGNEHCKKIVDWLEGNKRSPCSGEYRRGDSAFHVRI